MDRRRDALPAAAEFVLEVERLARSVDGLRATVGAIAAAPGRVERRPRAGRLSLDVRHADDAVRERAVADLLDLRRGRSPRAGGWPSGSTRPSTIAPSPADPRPDRPARRGRRATRASSRAGSSAAPGTTRR